MITNVFQDQAVIRSWAEWEKYVEALEVSVGLKFSSDVKIQKPEQLPCVVTSLGIVFSNVMLGAGEGEFEGVHVGKLRGRVYHCFLYPKTLELLLGVGGSSSGQPGGLVAGSGLDLSRKL